MDEFKEVPTKANDEESAIFLSRVFYTFLIYSYSYLLPLLRTGYERPLKKQDFCRLAINDESETLCDMLEKNWEQELTDSGTKKTPPDLHNAFYKTFKREYWFYGCFFFYQELLQIVQLIFMSRLIRFFQYCSEVSVAEAYAYAALFSVTTFCVVMVVLFLHFFWVAPASLVCYVAFAWYEMGPSCLAGFLALMILVPLQAYLGRKAGTYRQNINLCTDKRISLMSDLLNGIRVIKMYAWEKPFADLVARVRKLEIRQYRLMSLFQSSMFGLFFVNTKILVMFAVMTSYYMDGSGRMRSDNIFVATALFNMFRMTVGLFLPYAVQFYAEYRITVRRIQEFLMLKEQTTELSKDKSKEPSAEDNYQVSAINYSAKFSEESETFAVENITFRLKRGQLLMIVGPVGAGKSTILQCLCGDVSVQTNGSMKLNGQLVYVPQQPWIFPGSVRQNVIFGGPQPINNDTYKVALDACALNKDLESFPDNDRTFIGDRGAALSGGQKARIALARAVYFDADVYLMDDPLSAVDATVGRWIFEKCINEQLKGKTRILVTNQLQYLKFADQIIVLKQGKIEASGTFEELSELGDWFTAILRETEESFKQSMLDQEAKEQKQLIKEQTSWISDDEDDTSTVYSNSRCSSRFQRSVKRKSMKRRKSEQSKVNNFYEEQATEGTMKWNVVAAYFGSIGNAFIVWALIIFSIAVQVLFNLVDWWLNVWVDREDLSKLAAKVLHATNNSMSLSDSCLLSIPSVGQMLNESTDSNFVQDLSQIEEYLNYDAAFYAYVFVGSTFLLTLLSVLRSMAIKLSLTRSSLKLHNRMFQSLVRGPVWFYDQNPVGRILNRFSKDTGSMDELLSFVTFDLAIGLLTFFGVLLVIGFLNPWILFIMTPLCAIFLILRHYYIRSSRSIKRLEATTKSPIYAHLGSTLNGLSCIRSMNAQKSVLDDFHRFQNFHTSVFYASISVARWFAINIDCLCVIFISVVAFINVWSSQDQSAGSVGLSLFYAMSLLSFLQWTIRQTAEMETLLVSVERIMEYGDLPSETQDQGAGPLSLVPVPEWPQKGDIIFQNVKLRYTEDSGYILKGLTFHIREGEKIGIVGRTGAGKSSIINALFRLSATEGLISIDKIDIKSVDLQELRRRICIIPQDPVLFIGTLRQNLDPFEEYADSDIWRALELVELKNTFGNEDGLGAIIQEGGANLSVGQRQLICLARALLRKNKIIVIDEATANVDLRTDMLIQKTIREQFDQCTVLTIAHRINTIMDSTRILVMDSGLISEMDEPSVLLRNKNSAFSKLVLEASRNMRNE